MKEIERKARRLIDQSRVHIRWIEPQGIAAAGTVDGDTDTYSCSFSPAGRICTCPAGANHRDCSHALALELRVLASYDEELQLELV
jgi:hypothetical protein